MAVIEVDEDQLELVGTEIDPSSERELVYLPPAQLAQRQAAGKASAMIRYNNTERIDFIKKCGMLGAKARAEKTIECYFDSFHQYLELAAREGQKIGNMTAYLAMGVDHKTVEQWFRGEARGSDPRYRRLAEYVKAICASHREMLAMDGQIHPAMSIFWQKNYDGMNDEGILRIAQSDPFEVRSTDEIKEKYKDLVEE